MGQRRVNLEDVVSESDREVWGNSGFLAGVAGDEMKRRMWDGCGLCARGMSQ